MGWIFFGTSFLVSRGRFDRDELRWIDGMKCYIPWRGLVAMYLSMSSRAWGEDDGFLNDKNISISISASAIVSQCLNSRLARRLATDYGGAPFQSASPHGGQSSRSDGSYSTTCRILGYIFESLITAFFSSPCCLDDSSLVRLASPGPGLSCANPAMSLGPHQTRWTDFLLIIECLSTN